MKTKFREGPFLCTPVVDAILWTTTWRAKSSEGFRHLSIPAHFVSEGRSHSDVGIMSPETIQTLISSSQTSLILTSLHPQFFPFACGGEEYSPKFRWTGSKCTQTRQFWWSNPKWCPSRMLHLWSFWSFHPLCHDIDLTLVFYTLNRFESLPPGSRTSLKVNLCDIHSLVFFLVFYYPVSFFFLE